MSTWILLRGLTRESRHWGDFADTFRQAMPSARVLTPDLPGNGRLFRQKSPARIEAMVECYRQQLRDQDIPPPYRLLALSLGAMVAVDWARRHPTEISALVLINTSLRPFAPFWRRLRPGSYPSLIRQSLCGSDAAGRERLILALTSRHRQTDAGIVDTWAAYRRECPVSGVNALRQLLAAWRYQAPATRPAPPTLILSSRGDRLVDPRCSTKLAKRWGAAFANHPTAGHDLPLDDGPWVADRVRRWFASLG